MSAFLQVAAEHDRRAGAQPASGEAGAAQLFADRPAVQESAAMEARLNEGPRASALEALSGAMQRRGAAGAPAVQRQANRTGMPDGLKAGIEGLSGVSLDDVSVRYNSSEPAKVGALATTQGRDIHLAPGQEQHLGHEAWHAVQQKQGRVQPLGSIGGVPINDDASLEHEADVMGEKAAQVGERFPTQ